MEGVRSAHAHEGHDEEPLGVQAHNPVPIHITQCVSPYIAVPPQQRACDCKLSNNSNSQIWVAVTLGLTIFSLVAGFVMGWLAH